MDKEKMSGNEKLEICRRYFKFGLFGLPFVWMVNTIWFYKDAYKDAPFEQQADIKYFVRLSTIGAVIWTIVTIAWVITFQINRVAWGEFGDDISFIIPSGSP